MLLARPHLALLRMNTRRPSSLIRIDRIGQIDRGSSQPGFFVGVAGVALNYSLVVLIMVVLFVGRVVVRLSRRCAGFHAPVGGPFMIVGVGGVVVRSVRGST